MYLLFALVFEVGFVKQFLSTYIHATLSLCGCLLLEPLHHTRTQRAALPARMLTWSPPRTLKLHPWSSGAGVTRSPGRSCPWKGVKSTATGKRVAGAAEV